ncbi:HAD-IIB family hydrolase [Aeoliella sp. ICT_H6.2]|uniref:sucrose-phosphate synthase n=1 Tax=Aeoliella straminimaris TaxID=2954799 RepID=A0A9X2FHS5_9BACT|nr:HAD-IIB family hydrolase [Aeoliella straminimaris]MCO6046416.1 HAD-IIB family hydrolase [Aeoliella straminimaris]
MYIQLVSIHGLVRGRNVEMGADADTGGQIRYVLELAKTLAKHPAVDAVDLFTRRIRDKRVSSDYGQDIEELSDDCRIVRLPCGGGRYIRKEKLWPFLDDYIDAMIAFTTREGRTPTVVHGHYADAGYVAKEVACAYGVPFVFTGHSLGKPKLDYLEEEGWSIEQANKELTIEHRIAVEQECLVAADAVITSTRHERDQQYGKYHKSDELPFHIIPPGTDLDRFFPYYDYEMPTVDIDEQFKQARIRLQADLSRFYKDPAKPLILALCRPDRRKNIGALVQAFGASKELQAIANLAIFAGIRDDIESMPENEQRVLTDMLLAMDRFNLYGKLAIPKNHDSEYEVPELYRLAAASGGVFVNTAFVELFGLTAIESSATGLPFVVTENGGPQDIYENCESGLLVNVNDQEQLTSAMIELLTDRQKWDTCSSNGVNRVREHYTWETHVRHYVDAISKLESQPTVVNTSSTNAPVRQRLAALDRILITDIDNTLIGDDAACERLIKLLQENREHMGFGIASGRSLELVQEALDEHGIKDIDVIISSVGSEIYYGPELAPDRGWSNQLRSKWKPERIRAVLDELDFLHYQDRDYAQREFKVSYDLVGDITAEEAEPLLHEALDSTESAYSLILSHGAFVDVLPHRASKGKAVRFLARKWDIPIERVATAGDSGNDRDMLQGRTAGVVVGNHDAELANLKLTKNDRIYFAEGCYAEGIIEGLHHYRLLGPAADLVDESKAEELENAV